MSEVGAAAFWSYSHEDDEQDGGRILRLAKRIGDEYSLISGTPLRMFVDRKENQWGVVWTERIASALQETTFFIPIVTPRYFTRTECRAELMKFSTAASALGVNELILPVRYIPVNPFNESNSDDAIVLVSRMQYVDWSTLRLVDEQSAEYRGAVNKLAVRLLELNEVVSARPAASAPLIELETASDPTADPDGDDAPGVIDLLADFEPAMEQLGQIVNEIPPIMESFTDLTGRATERLNQATEQGKPFALRITIFRSLARELDAPSAAMEAVGKRYASELLKADAPARALIDLAVQVDSGDAEAAAAASAALSAIRGLASTSRQNMEAMKSLAATLRDNARLSRDLRPALRRIESGVRAVIDAQAILEDWDDLAGET